MENTRMELVREKFAVNKQAYRKWTTEIVVSTFCVLFFQIFHLTFMAFIKKSKK